MNVIDLIRPDIRTLTPYTCARHESESGLLLDANENPYSIISIPDDISLNRYPDPMQRELRARLADLNGVREDQLFVGVGSDEAIDLIIRLFCRSGHDAVAVLEPTYGMYRVAASINAVRVRSVPLGAEFELDVDMICRVIDADTRIVFCCSPNNPTGNLLSRDALLRLCRAVSAIVVVDEAYIDFAEADSLAPMVDEVPNLIVLRTLSKAWGLAGLRLGYAIAHPDITGYLLKIKSPYNINALTAHYALAALQNVAAQRQVVGKIVRERDRLAEALRSMWFVERVFPSDANFLLVRVRDAGYLCAELKGHGIVIRDRSDQDRLQGCVRITVGLPSNNDILISVLQEIVP